LPCLRQCFQGRHGNVEDRLSRPRSLCRSCDPPRDDLPHRLSRSYKIATIKMRKTLCAMVGSTILLLTLAGCDDPRMQPQPDASKVKVTTKLISPVAQKEVLSYSGTIEADNTVSLGFSVAGRVTAVNVQEGQRVSAGQLLATIETTEYQNSLLLAQAGLEQAADNFRQLRQLH